MSIRGLTGNTDSGGRDSIEAGLRPVRRAATFAGESDEQTAGRRDDLRGPARRAHAAAARGRAAAARDGARDAVRARARARRARCRSCCRRCAIEAVPALLAPLTGVCLSGGPDLDPARLRRRAVARARADRAGAGRLRARGRARRRRRWACRSSASAAARRRSTSPAAGRCTSTCRRSPTTPSTTARPRRAGRRRTRCTWTPRVAARRASSAPTRSWVNSFHHQAVDRLGARAAGGRVGAGRDGRGHRGRRASGSCSACSGTPRRSTARPAPAAVRGAGRRGRLRPARSRGLTMCGFGVEVRRAGPVDRDALERMGASLQPRGPDGAGLWVDGRVGMVHRRLAIIDLTERGAQPMGDEALGLDDRLQRLHLQPPRAARRAERARPLVRLAERHRGAAEGLGAVGRGAARRACTGCSPSRCTSARRAHGPGARPAGGQAAVPGRGRPAALRAASTLPALLAGGGVDTSVDPVALHHYLSWHSVVPAPRTILRGVRKLPPATLLVIEPDGAPPRARLLGPAVRARRALDVEDWPAAVRDALQVAVRRRMVADVPGRDPALGRAGLEPDRRAARRGGPARAGHVLDRLRGRRRARGRRVRVLGPGRARVRHRPPPDPDRPRAAGRRAAAGDRGDERADGLPRLRRVLAALGGGRGATARSCSPARAPTRCSAATTGTRRCSRPPGDGLGHLRGELLRPRRRGRRARCCADAPDDDVSLAFAARVVRARRAPRRRSTARCGSTPRSCSSTTRSSASTT